MSQGAEYRTSRPFSEQATRAAAVRAVLEQHGIRVNPACELAGLLTAAEMLASRDPARPISNDSEFQQMLLGAHFDRISDAILLVQHEPDPVTHLQPLTSQTLDFMHARTPSRAKDFFWELELWEKIKRRHPATFLREPDVMVETDGGDLPIACKKIYTQGGVESQLRKGVRQLKPFKGKGMVAINIDDLVQPSVHWRAPTTNVLGTAMERANEEFLRHHMTVLDDYFRKEKLSAVAVSVTLFSEIDSGGPRFNYMHQLTVMVSRYAQQSVRARLEILAASMGAQIET